MRSHISGFYHFILDLMTKPTFDSAYWEQLWSKTLREHGDQVALRPPNAHLV